MTSSDHPVSLGRTQFQILALFSRLLLFGLVAFAALAFTAAHAQPGETKISSEPAADVSTILDSLRAQLDDVQKGLKEPQDDATLVQFRSTALAAQTQADAAAARIDRQASKGTRDGH